MSTCFVEVSNISRSLRNRQIKELLECCGPIKNLDLKKESRICVVEYFDPNHATAALTLTGTMLGDKKLVVEAKSQPEGTEIIEAGVYSAEGKLIPATTVQLEAAALATETTALSGSSLAAAKKKAEEIARTIYVGNLHVDVLEDNLREFFASCGEILHVNLGGDHIRMGQRSGRFGFIEFKEIPHALEALKLSGKLLDDRPVKLGKAQSAIVKAEEKTKEKSLGSILAKIKAHASKISEKLDEPGDKNHRRRRRSRSRSRKRKSRSRSRKRKSRSRSRSRERQNRRSRRDRSRSPQKREPSPIPVPPSSRKKKVDRSGMFFDGYQWQPVTDLSQLTTAAPNRFNQK